MPPPNWQLRFPDGYNDSNVPNFHEDEHFQNWMRTAGLPTFTKLWGRNDEDKLVAATYQITAFMSKYCRLVAGIVADRLGIPDFPVKPYKGTKSIVISTVSWMGGKNPFLGWAYVAAASIFVALAVAGTIRHLVRPRCALLLLRSSDSPLTFYTDVWATCRSCLGATDPLPDCVLLYFILTVPRASAACI